MVELGRVGFSNDLKNTTHFDISHLQEKTTWRMVEFKFMSKNPQLGLAGPVGSWVYLQKKAGRWNDQLRAGCQNGLGRKRMPVKLNALAVMHVGEGRAQLEAFWVWEDRRKEEKRKKKKKKEKEKRKRKKKRKKKKEERKERKERRRGKSQTIKGNSVK